MIICPQCANSIENIALKECSKCSWTGDSISGVDIFLSNDDKTSDVFQKYLNNYEEISETDLVNDVLDSSYVLHQAKNLFDSITDLSNAKVCDLGCGQGTLTKLLNDSTASSVMSVDISLPYLKRLQGIKDVHPVLANAENLPFQDEFDIIVSTDVMEHVLNLGSFLYSLNRAMKAEGTAYIRVPYNENLLQYSRHFGCPYQFVHLRSFNRKLITEMLESSGFKVRRIFLDGFVIGTPQRFWLKSQRRMDFYEKFKKLVHKKYSDIHSITRWNSFLASIFMRPQEMVVIAEKEKNVRKKDEYGFFLEEPIK